MTGSFTANALTSTGGVLNLGTGATYSIVDNTNSGTTFKLFSGGSARALGYFNGNGLNIQGATNGTYNLNITPGRLFNTDAAFACGYALPGTSNAVHYFDNNVEIGYGLAASGAFKVFNNATITGSSTFGSGASVAVVDQGTLSLTKNSANLLVTPGLRKTAVTTNFVQYDIAGTGTVGTHFFNDNAEIDGNTQCNGTLQVNGAFQTNDAAKVLKTLTVGDTSLTGYLVVTPQSRKGVPAVDFCTYDLPGTATHFFWDNVEVDGTLIAPNTRFGLPSSYLNCTADLTTAIIDTNATLNPISIRTGGAERLSVSSTQVQVRNATLNIFSTTGSTLNFMTSAAPFGRIEMYGASLESMRFTASTNGSANTNAFTWTLTNSANSNVRMSLTDTAFTINMATAIKNTGISWANPSDARLKDVKGDYAKGLRELERIRPVKFTFKGNTPSTKGDKGEYVGVIAQELREVAPECVKVYDDTLDGVPTELLKVDASDLTWMLVNAVKELSQRVRQLESQDCSRCKRKRGV